MYVHTAQRSSTQMNLVLYDMFEWIYLQRKAELSPTSIFTTSSEWVYNGPRAAGSPMAEVFIVIAKKMHAALILFSPGANAPQHPAHSPHLPSNGTNC